MNINMKIASIVPSASFPTIVEKYIVPTCIINDYNYIFKFHNIHFKIIFSSISKTMILTSSLCKVYCYFVFTPFGNQYFFCGQID